MPVLVKVFLFREKNCWLKQVDILITASTFTPVPSLSAMVANYFGMRSDVLHYSLGGQGCTSGIIEVELAQHLLKARPQALLGTHSTATPLINALLVPS